MEQASSTTPAASRPSLKHLLLRVDYAARLLAVNEVGRFPGYRLRRWVYRRIGQVRMGERTWVHRGLRLFCLGGITLGDCCVVNPECWLDGRRGLTIGANVHLSVGTRILTLGHDPQDPEFAPKGGAVTIGDRAWLGAWCLVLPGVTIGEGAVVGAGTVVTKDVPPYAIIAGSPAKVIGERNRDLRYQIEWAPLFQ